MTDEEIRYVLIGLVSLASVAATNSLVAACSEMAFQDDTYDKQRKQIVTLNVELLNILGVEVPDA